MSNYQEKGGAKGRKRPLIDYVLSEGGGGLQHWGNMDIQQLFHVHALDMSLLQSSHIQQGFVE